MNCILHDNTRSYHTHEEILFDCTPADSADMEGAQIAMAHHGDVAADARALTHTPTQEHAQAHMNKRSHHKAPTAPMRASGYKVYGLRVAQACNSCRDTHRECDGESSCMSCRSKGTPCMYGVRTHRKPLSLAARRAHAEEASSIKIAQLERELAAARATAAELTRDFSNALGGVVNLKQSILSLRQERDAARAENAALYEQLRIARAPIVECDVDWARVRAPSPLPAELLGGGADWFAPSVPDAQVAMTVAAEAWCNHFLK